jgi:hypothetical protein
MEGLFMNDTSLGIGVPVTGIQIDKTTTKDVSQGIDISAWHMKTVQYTQNMFRNNTSLQGISLPITYIVKDGDKSTTYTYGISGLIDGSYMFADDPNLTTISLHSWQLGNADRLLGMFKNDTSLRTIDIHSWTNNGFDSGDSSKNEGMFDGTELDEIILGSSNKFSNYTILPSKKSTIWSNSDKSLHISANTLNGFDSIKGKFH